MVGGLSPGPNPEEVPKHSALPIELLPELEYIPLWILYVLGGTPVWWIACTVFG